MKDKTAVSQETKGDDKIVSVLVISAFVLGLGGLAYVFWRERKDELNKHYGSENPNPSDRPANDDGSDELIAYGLNIFSSWAQSQ